MRLPTTLCCVLIGIALLLMACTPISTVTVSLATTISVPTQTPTISTSSILQAPYTSSPVSQVPAPTLVITATLGQETLLSPTLSITPNENYTVLTVTQKERIYYASLSYLAPTESQAVQVARSLKFVKNDGHPSNMCGPLAVAILRDAGLISRYTDLHDFWLLNPRTDTQIIQRTFPEDEFTKYHYSQPINEFDFSMFPLQVGDFVYLYAGANGTFEHMLVVTRVDSQGRAYSVTNINTDEGYVIKEVMLYDPNMPGKGQFYEWTDRRNIRLGLTGFGGIDVWRRNVPILDPSPEEQILADQIDEILVKFGGDWHILIRGGEGHIVYSRLSNVKQHVASIIKVPIAMLFFKSLDLLGIKPREYQSYLSSHGQGGRTYEQLLYSMLVLSEEEATEIIIDSIRRSGLNVDQTLKVWGANQTDIFKRYSTAEDIALLMEGLYSRSYVAPEGRSIILKFMETYTSNDNTRLGVLRSLLPDGGHIYNKRATITAERLIVGDSGIVTWPEADVERVYILVLLGYPGEAPTTDVKMVQAIESIAKLFWNFAVHGEIRGERVGTGGGSYDR